MVMCGPWKDHLSEHPLTLPPLFSDANPWMKIALHHLSNMYVLRFCATISPAYKFSRLVQISLDPDPLGYIIK
jgi:hypothetical protein